MYFGDLRDQPKLSQECPRFLVRRFPFERVPVDRLAVGDRLEHFVEIV